jgi:hypothetical protein
MRNAIAAAVIAAVLGGCASQPVCTEPLDCPPSPAPPEGTMAAGYANPIFLPIADPQCAWETVVGVVGAYFRIEREEPIRIIGNEPIAGTITSVAEVSPTVFEPWRHDTVDPEQRVENTLQTMRRRAVVQVVPARGQNGCMVNVQVFKELEDLVRPEHATAGVATLRYDSSLTRIENPVVGGPIPQGPISRGRDTSMEQYIIGDLLSRCGQGGMPAVR